MTLTISENISIKETLNNNPSLNHLILLEGVYHEKVSVFHDNLTIEGKGNVIITYNDYATKIHEDGLEYNTFRTPTLTVFSNNVTLRNLTIKNEAGLSKDVHQALALALYGDNITIDNTTISSNQDTLFLGPLPIDLTIRYENFLSKPHLHTNMRTHIFKNSTIIGDVDFIFGSSNAFFINCHIIQNNKGYITAPSTYEGHLGFIFYKCLIENISSYHNYLSRPWRNYGYNAFINCEFKGVFHEDRYHDWEKHTFYYYEYPYINSPLSKPLTKLELDKLLNLIKTKST